MKAIKNYLLEGAAELTTAQKIAALVFITLIVAVLTTAVIDAGEFDLTQLSK